MSLLVSPLSTIETCLVTIHNSSIQMRVLTHLVYQPRGLIQSCFVRRHWHLCTPPPATWFNIETLYLVYMCTYALHMCTSNIYSGGSRISCWGGTDPLGGSTDLWHVHFLAKMYAKTKKWILMGGACAGGTPLDPPMI